MLIRILTDLDAKQFWNLRLMALHKQPEAFGVYSEKVIRVKLLFEKAKITFKVPEDIMYTMWQKLMANVGFNQITALTR